VIAHVGGFPVEELVPSLTLALGWILMRVRRGEQSGR
jgi:hypothetical protein